MPSDKELQITKWDIERGLAAAWECCHASPHSQKAALGKTIIHLNEQIAQRNQVIAELVAALERAKDDMESWQSYASSYFQEKHDALGDLYAIQTAIARAKALEVV